MKISPETLDIATRLDKYHGIMSIPYLQRAMKLSYKKAKAVFEKLKGGKE